MCKEIFVYDEAVCLTENNQRELKRLSNEYGIPEEILGTVWGYLTQAVIDCRGTAERANFKGHRMSVTRTFKKFRYLLTDYGPNLEIIAEVLPEMGCLAADPEWLKEELEDVLVIQLCGAYASSGS